jgi:hypothetical protein
MHLKQLIIKNNCIIQDQSMQFLFEQYLFKIHKIYKLFNKQQYSYISITVNLILLFATQRCTEIANT